MRAGDPLPPAPGISMWSLDHGLDSGMVQANPSLGRAERASTKLTDDREPSAIESQNSGAPGNPSGQLGPTSHCREEPRPEREKADVVKVTQLTNDQQLSRSKLGTWRGFRVEGAAEGALRI